MDIHVFVDISLQLSMLLWISIWISMDIHALTCYGFSIQGGSLRYRYRFALL